MGYFRKFLRERGLRELEESEESIFNNYTSFPRFVVSCLAFVSFLAGGISWIFEHDEENVATHNISLKRTLKIQRISKRIVKQNLFPLLDDQIIPQSYKFSNF